MNRESRIIASASDDDRVVGRCSLLIPFCEVLSDAARVHIIGILMDGSCQPASAIARMLNMSPQATRFHLRKLEEVNLLAVVSCGRHRYYEIASPGVAVLLESVFAIIPPPAHCCQAHAVDADFAFARTCYHHLAGSYAVKIAESLLQAGFLHHAGQMFELTPSGQLFFRQAGIRYSADKKGMVYGRRCIDVTERRAHVGGNLGAAIYQWMRRKKWFIAESATRTLKVSPCGRYETEQFIALIEKPVVCSTQL